RRSSASRRLGSDEAPGLNACRSVRLCPLRKARHRMPFWWCWWIRCAVSWRMRWRRPAGRGKSANSGSMILEAFGRIWSQSLHHLGMRRGRAVSDRLKEDIPARLAVPAWRGRPSRDSPPTGRHAPPPPRLLVGEGLVDGGDDRGGEVVDL